MTSDRAVYGRGVLESERAEEGETLEAQSHTDALLELAMEAVDAPLAGAYGLACTSYWASRIAGHVASEGSVRTSLGVHFREPVDALEALVDEDVIPSLEFGFFDVVLRGIGNRGLAREYVEHSALQELYERAVVARQAMDDSGINLPKHSAFPHVI